MPTLSAVKRYTKRRLRQLIFRARLKNPDFCLVANNCWGSRIYQELDFKYNTPFVGLFFYSPCYIRLLSDLKYFLDQKIEFIEKSKYPKVKPERQTDGYPIGLLGGQVEIHFLHYSSDQEALETWQRRVQRVRLDNLFVAFSDRELFFEEDHLAAFEELPFTHKVFFTAKRHLNTSSSVWISECASEPFVTNLYAKSYLVHRHFDVIDWLNGGSGKLSPIIHILNKFLG